MKYFTYEMWRGINCVFGKEKTQEYWDMWANNRNEYWKLFASIAKKLDVKTYKYLSTIGFHDFRLVKMELLHNEYSKKPALQIKIFVTDKINIFEIHFKNVLKFEVKSVENDKYNRGLDDWGYEEILPVDEKSLSFEVLFASGATIFIVFPNKALKINQIDCIH